MFKSIALILVLASFGSAVKEGDVKFLVYTARQNAVPMQVRLGEFAFVDIDPVKEVKILCHGWMDNGNAYWIEPTKAALMSTGQTNVISIDWSAHAMGLYSASVNRARPVANFIADLVVELANTHQIPISSFHLIGHSLGSHISGFAAKRIFEMTGQKVGRISGLDPAGPSFNDKSETNRLSKNDAVFVDVMHTDTTFAGFKKSLGHVDYWPNGGSGQAGCGSLSNCSHVRAPTYFAESVTTDGFAAWECGSTRDFNGGKCTGNRKILMGERVDRSARGDFYLSTNKDAPFACNC